MHKFDIFSRISLVIVDYIALLAAFSLAYFVRVGWIFSTDFPFWPYFKVSLIVSLVWIGFFVVFRLYALQKRTDSKEHVARLILVNLLGTGTFILFFFSFRKLLFSRLILIYVFLISTLLLVLTHYFSEKIRGMYSRKSIGISRVLIIGTNRSASKLLQALRTLSSKHRPVAILDGYGSNKKEIAGVPILGKLNILESTVDKYEINEIIQVDNIEQALNIITFCQKKGLKYAMLPSLLGVFHDQIEVETLEFQPVVRLKDRKKRIFELIFGNS
jgi:FlaA1/EpsC-like NDP-sugar epimerase